MTSSAIELKETVTREWWDAMRRRMTRRDAATRLGISEGALRNLLAEIGVPRWERLTTHCTEGHLRSKTTWLFLGNRHQCLTCLGLPPMPPLRRERKQRPARYRSDRLTSQRPYKHETPSGDGVGYTWWDYLDAKAAEECVPVHLRGRAQEIHNWLIRHKVKP